MTRRAKSCLVALALLTAACTSTADSSGSSSEGTDGTSSPNGGAPSTTEPCEPAVETLTLDAAPGWSSASLIRLSEAVFDCPGVAVVLGTLDLASARLGASTAIELGVPLLTVVGPDDLEPVRAELKRLEAERIVTIGLDAATIAELNVGDVEEVLAPTPTSTTEATTTTQPPTTTESSTTTSDSSADASATSASSEAPVTTTTPFEPLPGTSSGLGEGPLVIFRPGDEVAAYLVSPAVVQGDGEVVVTSATEVDELRAIGAGRADVYLWGDLTATEQWQIALASSDAELFGGGTQVFPDRRIIAYYGNPLTGRLGILGETTAERAIERVTERAALYNAEGLPPALPGFEIIVTVASNEEGDDGNYSREMDPEVVRPWIDAAMANDVAVILDLQPGRTDFLTQAKIYEEFLRLPNVGLALDPEWRLKPDQRHLRQIGRVGADEINEVVDYLTTLVHEETLPQKILILHQFNTQMLPERELVNTPPEVAVVIHVDGQGPLFAKYGTWDAMLEAPIGPNQDLFWAWKNFIDEDFPTASPGQVNRVEPLPVIVTYQ